MDARILEAVKEDSRYAYEAYEFVCDAVKFTQDRLGLGQDNSDEEADNHVGAADLLSGCCEMAIRDFGMMAPVVFEHWGVRSTDDLGNIVFNLIHIDRLKSSERDDPDDFRDAFDLNRALTEGFELTVVPAGSRKAAER